MAHYRMQHEEHGFHVAYNGAEVLAHEKLGWKRISDSDFAKLIAAKSAVEPDEEVIEAPRKKPGPKPKA